MSHTERAREMLTRIKRGVGAPSLAYDEADAVRELAQKAVRKVAGSLDDPFAVMAFTEQDIAGPAGRARLSDALKDAINLRLEKLEGFGGVEDVFFPSFMMQ